MLEGGTSFSRWNLVLEVCPEYRCARQVFVLGGDLGVFLSLCLSHTGIVKGNNDASNLLLCIDSCAADCPKNPIREFVNDIDVSKRSYLYVISERIGYTESDITIIKIDNL
jgi:hypothetical protein